MATRRQFHVPAHAAPVLTDLPAGPTAAEQLHAQAAAERRAAKANHRIINLNAGDVRKRAKRVTGQTGDSVSQSPTRKIGAFEALTIKIKERGFTVQLAEEYVNADQVNHHWEDLLNMTPEEANRLLVPYRAAGGRARTVRRSPHSYRDPEYYGDF